MIASILMFLSAAIILLLGAIHLLYTFHGPKLTPRDPALQVKMGEVSPVLTKDTSMWKAWVGFNASHSMGAILFGLIYAYLALAHTAVLFNSPFLLITGLVMLGGLLALAKAYWFRIPLAGIALSLACYLAGIAFSFSS